MLVAERVSRRVSRRTVWETQSKTSSGKQTAELDEGKTIDKTSGKSTARHWPGVAEIFTALKR